MQIDSKKVVKLLSEVKLTRTLHLIWSLSPVATVLSLIMIAVENGLFLLVAFDFKHLINVIGPTVVYTAEKIATVKTYLIEGFIIVVLYVVAKALSQYISEVQASRVGEYIDDKIHASAVELDLAFYESPEYFDTLKRAKDAGSDRPNAVVTTLVDVLKNIVTFIILSGVIITINWLMLPILAVCIVPTFLVRVSLAEKLFQLKQKHTPIERKASYLSSLITGDSLAKEVRSFGLGNYLKEMYLSIRLSMLTQRLKIVRRGAVNDMITSILGSAGFFGCVTFICYNAIKGKIGLGDISMFLIIFPQLFNILQSLSQGMSAIYQNSIFITYLFQFFDLKPVLTETAAPVEMSQDTTLAMRMENVNFTYPNSTEPVLKNINISL